MPELSWGVAVGICGTVSVLHVAAVSSSWSFETKLLFICILVQICSWSSGFLLSPVTHRLYRTVWVPVLSGRAGQPFPGWEGRSTHRRHGVGFKRGKQQQQHSAKGSQEKILEGEDSGTDVVQLLLISGEDLFPLFSVFCMSSSTSSSISATDTSLWIFVRLNLILLSNKW